MDSARIADLLEPFLRSANTPDSCHSEPGQRPGEEPAVPSPASDQRLTTIDLDRISTYIDLLLRWNARINLTAIRDPEAIVTRHFGESFFAARHLFPGGRAALQGRVRRVNEPGALAPEVLAQGQRPTANDRVADLGSGAGFPGLPIKLWAPHITLTLIESNQKKATFLREVTRALTLTNVNIETARAEDLPGVSFGLVTLRAVERFADILSVAASLVAPAGRLALLIGSAQFDQARAALPKFTWAERVPIAQSRSRVLAMGRLYGAETNPVS